MKLITRLIVPILSGALILLGFGGCKSAKKAAARAEEQAEEQAREQAERERLREMERQDSIQRAEEIRRRTRPDNEPIRVLYGPPPSSYLKNIDKY